VDEVETCGNIMKVGRWQCRSPRNIIIMQDIVMACRLGRILRSRGESEVEEEGGKNGGKRTMGRRVATKGLIRTGEGRP